MANADGVGKIGAWPEQKSRGALLKTFEWPLAGCLALLPGVCAAQTGLNGQSIEVTGTRLRGVDAEGYSPIQVVTGEEIKQRGVGSLRELLAQLSSNTGGPTDIGGNGTFAPGATGTSMRNLGIQSTLILLNFRRVAPYPLANDAEIFTNIDALPFEAIERVEVLKSGASALYGSDAVAGVINIITRRDWTGVQARLSQEHSLTSGRFRNITGSVTAGLGDPGGSGGHLLANLELYRRESVIWRDVLQYVDPELTSRSPGFGTFSSYSWPGNVIGGGPVQGCAPELIQGGLCKYDRYARFEAMPASERANLLLTGHLPLPDGRRLFSEVLLAKTSTTYLSPFQPYGTALSPITWGDPLNNSVQTFTYRGLPIGHPLNTAGVDNAEFRYRFIDGPNQETADTTQYRALAGVAGLWNGMDWETAAGVMGGRTHLKEQGWYSLKGFREVIGNDDPAQPDPKFFNRAYRIGQTNSPEVIQKLFPVYGYRGHVQQYFVDGKLTGDVGQLANGPVKLAVGGEVRRERFTIDPSEALRSGDIVGNGLSASDASRTAGSAFIEAAAPFGRGTEVQAAARLDKFGSFAPHLSPKVGLRFQPFPQLLFRATAEAGFRAPNLVESADSTKFSSESLADPRRCAPAQALAADLRKAASLLSPNDPQATLLGARADNVTTVECQGSVATIIRNNPDLKPESSRSLNAGLVLSGSRAWSVSLDVWDIRRHDEIGLKSASELLSAEAAQPLGTVDRLPLASDPTFTPAEQKRYGVTSGLLRSVVGRYNNLARTRTQGLDLAGKASFQSPLGELELQLDGTYLSIFKAWSPVLNDWGNNLAGHGHVRWLLNLGAKLKTGAWSHWLHALTYPSVPLHGDFYDTQYTAQGCADAGYSARDCSTPGYTRWDYGLSYSGLGQVTLGLNIFNVFGTVIPQAAASWLNAGGIAPVTFTDASRRTLRLTLEWRSK